MSPDGTQVASAVPTLPCIYGMSKDNATTKLLPSTGSDISLLPSHPTHPMSLVVWKMETYTSARCAQLNRRLVHSRGTIIDPHLGCANRTLHWTAFHRSYRWVTSVSYRLMAHALSPPPGTILSECGIYAPHRPSRTAPSAFQWLPLRPSPPTPLSLHPHHLITPSMYDALTGSTVLGPLQATPTGSTGSYSLLTGLVCSLAQTMALYIASASWDRTLRIWDADNGQDVHGPMDGHDDSVNCVRFSPDASTIVSGSRDGTVRLWDVKTGQCMMQLFRATHQSRRSDSLPMTGTGDTVVGPVHGHSDGRMTHPCEYGMRRPDSRLWFVTRMAGHMTIVISVGFSPNGLYIVSGSWDKTLRNEVATQEEMAGGESQTAHPGQDHIKVLDSWTLDDEGWAVDSESAVDMGPVGSPRPAIPPNDLTISDQGGMRLDFDGAIWEWAAAFVFDSMDTPCSLQLQSNLEFQSYPFLIHMAIEAQVTHVRIRHSAQAVELDPESSYGSYA
ncbi:peptidase C14 [Rhizoctonia solani]|uniref:Peptidase C14 n=1 Tax=Rhizoctonia solani TaxID=456999 RepID=A0A8H8P1F5_9AGAM|nr:peptidase C14 [Rhizoctonia solani]QRW22582.1 peptidase C14 [Rhizoctonia solani]